MYETYFGLTEAPFSIAPDPRYLYLSQRHQEALAHLLYGVNSGGGFVLLTGEVGAGKTTVCRCLLEQIPPVCDVAYIFNPQLTVGELLSTICVEFGISIPPDTTRAKVYIDNINAYLLDAHAKGRHSVLIIDEAQGLSIAVLEQMRLLTNLETNQRKLLQIILLGQPELAAMLARSELRQLAQRIVARYHLMPLGKDEVAAYVKHRLEIAGTQRNLFPARVLNRLYRLSGGIPRVINVLCDRALLGAYVQSKEQVNNATLSKAAREVFGTVPRETGLRRNREWPFRVTTLVLIAGLALAITAGWKYSLQPKVLPAQAAAAEKTARAVPNTALAAKSNTPLPAILEWPTNEARANSKTVAYTALFKAWGVDYRAGDTCARAEGMGLGLHCLTARGGLNEVRYHNRPAVLLLHDNQGQEFHATLTGLDDTSAIFTIGNVARTVAIGALANQWSGHYTLLWRMPPDIPINIHKGDRRPAVEWMSARLAQVQGRTVETGRNPVFDNLMEQQVKQFQLTQGLVPDGAPGPMTLIRLNSETDQTAPRLFRTLGNK
jgi:general secretion pathway protein A